MKKAGNNKAIVERVGDVDEKTNKEIYITRNI